MALTAPNTPDSTSGGVLHWLQPDSSFYEGNPTVQTVISSPNSTSDWLVQMNGWTFSSGGKSISSAGQNLQVAVDPYYPNIYIPQDEAQLICKLHYTQGLPQQPLTFLLRPDASIPGSSPQQPSTLSQAFSVPCNTRISFATVFGSQTFILDQSTLVVKQNGTCISAIEAWNDPNNSEYLLGATFISSVYLYVLPER
jgi:hypothetical protein